MNYTEKSASLLISPDDVRGNVQDVCWARRLCWGNQEMLGGDSSMLLSTPLLLSSSDSLTHDKEGDCYLLT